MNWLINRLQKPGASGQECSLECDVQEGVARTDALVRWGRKVEGGGRTFQDFFVFWREFGEGIFGVFEK